jgi:RimJ/RimL family protein N-acetyltransferase
MSTARDARPPKRILRFDCGRYFVRTIKREDASDRWAGWLADPWAAGVMNSPARTLGKRDIADYIRQFDQRSRLLLGIFEKGTRAHVGIIRIDADYVTNECHVNVLIGDPEYRGRGLMSEISVATFDYIFEETATRKLTASTLARNELIKSYLIGAGWQLDETHRQAKKSAAGGAMLDLCSFSLTREAWRAWKETSAAKRILRRLGRLGKADAAAGHRAPAGSGYDLERR